MVGLGRVELPTSRLSGVRSNQLSYRPVFQKLSKLDRVENGTRCKSLYKEVIQPHVPVRLPCYDFTPITSISFGAFILFRLDQRLLELPAFVM